MGFVEAKKIVELNRALFQVTHGLYILTTCAAGYCDGQCLDSLMQVTNNPPQIAIGVNKKNLTHEYIERTGYFTINVLDKKDADWRAKVKLYGMHSGRDLDKFADKDFTRSASGAPILPDAQAYYECTLLPEKTLDLGTHSLFVGLVTRAGVKDEGEPLTYNEYRKLIKKGGKNG